VSRAIQGGRNAGRNSFEPSPAGCVAGMGLVGSSVGPACTMVASRRGEVAAVGEEEMRVAGWPTRKPRARESPAASKATLRRLLRDGTILLACVVVRGEGTGNVGMTHTIWCRGRPPASVRLW